MAEFDFKTSWFLDRLKKKYIKTDTRPTLGGMLQRILYAQNKKISERIADTDAAQWNGLKKNHRWRNLIIPPMADILPTDASHSRRAGESAKRITDTLKGRVSADIKSVLLNYDPHKPITAEMLKEMRTKLRSTMAGYTKKHPKYNTPINVNAISTTELGGTVNRVKDEFAKQVLRNNKDIEMTKTWVHTRRHPAGYTPRPHHLKMDGKTIKLGLLFTVPDGNGGITPMERPHDPKAPIEQTINCLCSCTYKLRNK